MTKYRLKIQKIFKQLITLMLLFPRLMNSKTVSVKLKTLIQYFNNILILFACAAIYCMKWKSLKFGYDRNGFSFFHSTNTGLKQASQFEHSNNIEMTAYEKVISFSWAVSQHHHYYWWSFKKNSFSLHRMTGK